MATSKLSQIVPAPSPPALGDQFVAVRGGAADLLFSQAQMESVFSTAAAPVQNPVHAVAVTPTVTPGSNYGAFVCIGGVLHFSNVFSAPNFSGRLTFARITVRVKLDIGLTLYVLKANPSASVFNDNALTQINAVDCDKVVMALSLMPLTQLGGLGGHAIYAGVINAAIAPGGSDLWGVVVGDAQLTTQFGSVADVLVELSSISD